MIRRQIVLPVEAETLWAALTDPDQTEGWFGGRLDWEVREGAPLIFRDGDGSTRHGEVDVVRPARYLRYRWWPADEGPSGGSEASEVSYLLEPDDDGTRLTIQERTVPTGPRGAPSSCARDIGAATASSFSWSCWDARMAGAWVSLAACESARV